MRLLGLSVRVYGDSSFAGSVWFVTFSPPYDVSFDPLEVGYKATRIFGSGWIEYLVVRVSTEYIYEMWYWGRMQKISWTDHVRYEEVLLRVKEQRNILHEISKRKANWIGHILRRNCLLQRIIEGEVKGGDRSDRNTRKMT